MNVDKITKEQLDAIYNKHPETKFISFMYTYYNLNMKSKPTPIGTWVAVISWIIATVGLIVFDQLGMKEVANSFLWIYIPFGAFIFVLPAFLLNMKRTKRIAKELGITTEEYNYLITKYYS